MPRNPFTLSTLRPQVRRPRLVGLVKPTVTYDFEPINKNLDAIARSTDPELADVMAEITEAAKAEIADCVHEMEPEIVAMVMAEQAQTRGGSTQAHSGPPWRRRRSSAYSASQPKPEPLDIKVVVQPDNAPTK
jgi:hypothetical protein